MDNIQLCYIDNEINKIDKMKQGDVIYKNGMELLVVLSYDHNEPCKGCFFYKNKACGSGNMPAVIGMDGDRLNGRVFQLSPLFVEEMMGYPLMWTTLPFLTGNGEKNQ